MYRPALYHKSHKAAKKDVGHIIKEYSTKLQWRIDGKDTLLDVGSGPGDVLMDYIYPLMPQNFDKVVCSDISEDMVDFARNYYRSAEKCEFCILDIATKDNLPINLIGQFDHVMSMLCLHWVQDYRVALKNIHDLIRPTGGDCLLIFMSSHTIFDAYNYTNRYTKWSEYMKDVDRFISPLHYSTDAKAEFATFMKEAGFSDVTVEVRTKTMNYKTVENFKENIKSVCGALNTIPISKSSEFLDDFIAVMSKFMPHSDDLNEMHSKFSMKYDLLVAYGKKENASEL